MQPDREQEIIDAVISRLVEVRTKKRISQNRLAEMAGLSRSGIRHLENGETSPTLYSLLKISQALDVKIGRLIGSLLRAQK